MQDKPLTAKQAAFIPLYCDPASKVYNNAKQAGIRAGFSETTANNSMHQVLGNIGVITAIQVYRAKIAKKMEVTRQYCIDKLQHILENSDSERNQLTAISLLGDFTGDKREKSPNLGKLDEIRQRMDIEEVKYRQEFTFRRCTQEAGKGIE